MRLQKDKEKEEQKVAVVTGSSSGVGRDRFNIGKKWFPYILYHAESHERRIS
jgi:hypothetical protein